MLYLGVICLDNMNLNTKKCEFCSEEIEINAKRCPHCGSLLEVEVEDMNNKNMEQDDNIYNINSADNEKDKKEPVFTNSESTSADDNRAQVNKSEIPNGISGSGDNMRRNQNAYNNYKSNASNTVPFNYERNTLSNGLKVFLTVICTIVPGLGQLAGIIVSIIFMNSPDYEPDSADKRSFGLALLIACIIMFVIACISCFALIFVFSSFQDSFY